MDYFALLTNPSLCENQTNSVQTKDHVHFILVAWSMLHYENQWMAKISVILQMRSSYMKLFVLKICQWGKWYALKNSLIYIKIFCEVRAVKSCNGH